MMLFEQRMKDESFTTIVHSHELQKQIGPDFKTESASCSLGLAKDCANDRYHDQKVQGVNSCINVSIRTVCVSHIHL